MPLNTSARLQQIAPETYAYLHSRGTWGLSNCGLIRGDDGVALLVDTQFTLPMTEQLLDSVARMLPRTKISTVVLTHANGDHAWGTQLFPEAVVISSEHAADGLDGEIPPAAMAAMTDNSDPNSPIGVYMREFFAHFDWGGIQLRQPDRTFHGSQTLDVGGRVVELIEVGPAHTDGDVIVHVPDASVVYAGDILFVGDHPVMWSGPIGGWIAACDRILATGATVIVPGHGPVIEPDGVTRFRGYLEHVADYAQQACQAGVPYYVAAAEMPLTGFEDWGHAERLVVTIGGIYRELGHPEPGGREVLIGRMAARYQELRGNTARQASGI